MVHSSMENLQFDRRLQGRRNWTEPDSFEKHLEELPDVADKAVMVGLEDAADPAPSSTPEPPAPAPGVEFPPSQS